jgi:acyl carrier protein
MSGNGKPDVVAIFKRVASEVTKKDVGELTLATQISQLDIDSVAVMEIVGCIEDELSIVLPNETLVRISTVGDLVREIEARF